MGTDRLQTGQDSQLVSVSAWARWQAVQRLARRQDESARTSLMDALADPSAIVRWRAALALGQRHDTRTLSALRERAGQSAAYRASVWDALSRVARSSSVLDWEEPLQSEDDELRQAAVEAIGRLGATAYRPQLLSMAQDVDEAVAVRYAALSALADMPAEGDISSVLGSALRDGCPLIRAGAARAAGRLDVQPLAAALAEALQDADGYVRCEAAWALGRVGERQHMEALKQALAVGQGYEAARLRRQVRRALWLIRWRVFVGALAAWPKRWLGALGRATQAHQEESQR